LLELEATNIGCAIVRYVVIHGRLGDVEIANRCRIQSCLHYSDLHGSDRIAGCVVAVEAINVAEAIGRPVDRGAGTCAVDKVADEAESGAVPMIAVRIGRRGGHSPVGGVAPEVN